MPRASHIRSLLNNPNADADLKARYRMRAVANGAAGNAQGAISRKSLKQMARANPMPKDFIHIEAEPALKEIDTALKQSSMKDKTKAQLELLRETIVRGSVGGLLQICLGAYHPLSPRVEEILMKHAVVESADDQIYRIISHHQDAQACTRAMVRPAAVRKPGRDEILLERIPRESESKLQEAIAKLEVA